MFWAGVRCPEVEGERKASARFISHPSATAFSWAGGKIMS